MPIWPFSRRQSSVISEGSPQHSSSEKRSLPLQSPTFPRRASRATPQSTTRPSQPSQLLDRSWSEKEQRQEPEPEPEQEQEQVPERQQEPGLEYRTGDGNLSAPPTNDAHDMPHVHSNRRMASSPHLRQPQQDRPAIPTNFRRHSSMSQNIAQQEPHSNAAHPRTLDARRSGITYDSPQRHLSTRSRRRDHGLNNQEIRDMLSSLPTPKRAGDIPLRRDSKKIRGVSLKGSTVSLPHDVSVYSSSAIHGDARAWEVGSLAVFNPRPSVRLSSMPQPMLSDSQPADSAPAVSRDDVPEHRLKTPAPRTPTGKKRQTVGDQADDLDASDLRTVLERDAKRKARVQQRRERATRAAHDTASSDAVETRDGRLRARSLRSQGAGTGIHEIPAVPQNPFASPLDIHPAFRHQASDPKAAMPPSALGLGIAGKQKGRAYSQTSARQPLPSSHPRSMADEPPIAGTIGDIAQTKTSPTPQDPFSDTEAVHVSSDRPQGPSSDLDAPTGRIDRVEAYIGAAVDVSPALQAQTPPLSPIYVPRPTASSSQLSGLHRSDGLNDLERDPPVSVATPTSPAVPGERRSGTWTSLFRRGQGNKFSRESDARASSSELSFSNTSRESMRNQPLPAHLVDTQSQRFPTSRARSGTPARTQSKFREDLPELPVSPPASRTQSPEVRAEYSTAIAGRLIDQPHAVDSINQSPKLDVEPRGDTEVGVFAMPTAIRKHGQMSGSLASIDTEGSWLASGGSIKRRSNQSTVSRSLSKRNPDFAASYEELGLDKDMEYLQRNQGLPSPERRAAQMMTLNPEEERGVSDNAMTTSASTSEPFRLYDGVQRQPTLVRKHRVKSREGLLTETAAIGMVETQDTGDDKDSPVSAEYEPDSPGPELQNARSVKYGSRHSRQFSAGSAKLLDLPPSKRPSIDINADLPGSVFPKLDSTDR